MRDTVSGGPDWALRIVQHLGCHRPHQQAAKPTITMSWHHDQIDLVVDRVICDYHRRISERDLASKIRDSRELLVREELEEQGSHLLLDRGKVSGRGKHAGQIAIFAAAQYGDNMHYRNPRIELAANKLDLLPERLTLFGKIGRK